MNELFARRAPPQWKNVNEIPNRDASVSDVCALAGWRAVQTNKFSLSSPSSFCSSHLFFGSSTHHKPVDRVRERRGRGAEMKRNEVNAV